MKRSSAQKKSNFRFQNGNTTLFGILPFRGLGPKLRALIPNELKYVQSLDVFKNMLRKIKFE